MSNNLLPQFCPYKGLQPYMERDSGFFFGRERDQQIIISNLYAAQLTVLYGASGVGKSSVLLAGAVPLLKKERNLAVVVFRDWQDAGFVSELKKNTLQSVSEAAGHEISIDLSLSLDEFLEHATRALRGAIFFIFDQFEEYFLYNPQASEVEGFEGEFASAVNRREVNVNFLLSMREDSLSKLDRFQSRIPTLLNNMLRLEHLDRDSARDAITKPLAEYNRQLKNGKGTVAIEASLVEAVLDDLRGVRVASERTGQGAVDGPSPSDPATEIETPFLQMVLTRLWNEEHLLGSFLLRLQTFQVLGGAENIARTHLETIVAKLTESERNIATNIFRYLVTPSGAKIAQEAGALADWCELRDDDVQTVLGRLGAPDMRILRVVQAPGQPARYEIFHDVLAHAILDWRAQYVAAQAQERIRREEQERREQEQLKAERLRELERAHLMRRVIIGLSMLVIITIGVAVYAFQKRREAIKAKEDLTYIKDQEIKAEQRRSEDVRTAGINMRNALMFVKNGQFEEAVKEYDKAIKLDLKNPTGYSLKGYAQLRLGQYPQSIETLKHLTVEVDSSYVLGHYNLALAYSKAGQPELAAAEVETVLQLDAGYCGTFMKDPSYGWVLKLPKYRAQCDPTR